MKSNRQGKKIQKKEIPEKKLQEKKQTDIGKRKQEKGQDVLAKSVLFGLAFLIPVIVMLIVLKSRGFYPFGEKTMFIMDMKDQYLEFFASLRNVLSGDDSLFFSWSRSMGGNYLGLFAYYVASPLSFLTIFFPLKKLTSAIVLLTILKIGLSGMSFAVFGAYLWNRTKGASAKTKQSNDNSLKKEERHNITDWKVLIVLPFAVCYALISYNMVYSMCLMWLDGVILLPVVLLGVEKILDGRRGFHYMLALAALFICNYYTGYMVGVFTAIYTVYRILCKVGKNTVKEYIIKLLRFTATTILAAGISAPLLLPVVRDLMQGKLAAASYLPDSKTNFVFSALFGKFKNGAYDSITNTGLPAIYCGYLAVLLVLVFFVLRRVTVREKIGAVLILALLACSFYFTKWDIAWHGFQYPTWFPYRYAFVFSFFMLYLAVRSACEICSMEKQTVKQVSGAGIAATAFVLTLISSVEMGVNGKALFAGLENEFGYGTVEEYEGMIEKTQPLVEQIKEQDQGFYRVNQGYEYSKNDAMLFGYHGMTHYSSTFHASVNALTPKLGIAQAHIWNSGYGTNPLLDSLFAIKYILDDGLVPSDYAQIASSQGGASVYANGNVLPVAYGASAVNLNPDLSSPDPFVNQNTLLNTIAGTEKFFFTEYEYSYEQPDNSWCYTFTADSSNPVYLYMKSDSTSWADVYVNDVWVGNYFSTETSCSLYLGNFQPGQQVAIRVIPSDAILVNYAMIGQLHMDLLEETISTLQKNGMEVSHHKGGKLSGKITLDKQQRVITSIPYDSGWTVRIDGKKADTTKFADTFLAVEAEAGEHTITFSYTSPGFGMGMVILIIAVFGAVVYFIVVDKFRIMVRKSNDRPEMDTDLIKK